MEATSKNIRSGSRCSTRMPPSIPGSTTMSVRKREGYARNWRSIMPPTVSAIKCESSCRRAATCLASSRARRTVEAAPSHERLAARPGPAFAGDGSRCPPYWRWRPGCGRPGLEPVRAPAAGPQAALDRGASLPEPEHRRGERVFYRGADGRDSESPGECSRAEGGGANFVRPVQGHDRGCQGDRQAAQRRYGSRRKRS